ncbi:hypothetical protein B0T21DRAFT_453645 [Apiosordaria backusii]|uniref:Uncharacterized protein n=1 Tax=Apiosordaria backusii TaxID=314023 RepID=A0AA40ASM1_9PEZI|nr:hypothetical protein B0T21DRAFT_453645 [Apiosordaria backusii]
MNFLRELDIGNTKSILEFVDLHWNHPDTLFGSRDQIEAFWKYAFALALFKFLTKLLIAFILYRSGFMEWQWGKLVECKAWWNRKRAERKARREEGGKVKEEGVMKEEGQQEGQGKEEEAKEEEATQEQTTQEQTTHEQTTHEQEKQDQDQEKQGQEKQDQEKQKQEQGMRELLDAQARAWERFAMEMARRRAYGNHR